MIVTTASNQTTICRIEKPSVCAFDNSGSSSHAPHTILSRLSTWIWTLDFYSLTISVSPFYHHSQEILGHWTWQFEKSLDRNCKFFIRHKESYHISRNHSCKTLTAYQLGINLFYNTPYLYHIILVIAPIILCLLQAQVVFSSMNLLMMIFLLSSFARPH